MNLFLPCLSSQFSPNSHDTFPPRPFLLFRIRIRYLSFLSTAERKGYSPLAKVDIGLLADDVGVSPTDTTDLGEGVHDLDLAVDVGVQETQDVVEVLRGVRSNERLQQQAHKSALRSSTILVNRRGQSRPIPTMMGRFLVGNGKQSI